MADLLQFSPLSSLFFVRRPLNMGYSNFVTTATFKVFLILEFLECYDLMDQIGLMSMELRLLYFFVDFFFFFCSFFKNVVMCEMEDS